MSLPSDAKRTRLALIVLLACEAALGGCADARGRFEDFQARVADGGAGAAATDGGDLDATYEGAPCAPPAPGTVSGPALLAVATALAADRPILFVGDIDTPALEGTTGVHYVYRALDSLDRRTPVGARLEVGPFPLHDGELLAEVPESELDGNANPVLHGAPISSMMTLSGHICGTRRFYCGTLTGQSTGLVTGPFTGKFGITLLNRADDIPERPRFGCGEGDLAEPLPD